jgi:hypothetical protein
VWYQVSQRLAAQGEAEVQRLSEELQRQRSHLEAETAA